MSPVFSKRKRCWVTEKVPARARLEAADSGPPKTLIILFDTSLSMQWEKLERSYQALETLLRTLRPADRFNLVLFNGLVQSFQPSPVTADPATVQRALDFVRSSKLRGGTDLQRALQAGLQQCSTTGGGNSYLLLLSDGGATRGPIQNGKLAAWYAETWQRVPAASTSAYLHLRSGRRCQFAAAS